MYLANISVENKNLQCEKNHLCLLQTISRNLVAVASDKKQFQQNIQKYVTKFHVLYIVLFSFKTLIFLFILEKQVNNVSAFLREKKKVEFGRTISPREEERTFPCLIASRRTSKHAHDLSSDGLRDIGNCIYFAEEIQWHFHTLSFLISEGIHKCSEYSLQKPIYSDSWEIFSCMRLFGSG